MDLRHLQTLCAVIDSGGFTRAADRLYLTQSAVSIHIRQLEDALGTTLFERSPSGVRPTQSGEVLYRYARKLLLLAAEAREEITSLELSRQGRVRIGATDVCALFLPEALRGFSEQHPDVEIAIFEGPASSVLDRVRTGQVDIGLVPQPPDADGIAFDLLLELELFAVFRGDHPLATHATVNAYDLTAHPLAVCEPGSVYRQVVERACASVGLRPRVAFESNWLTSLLRAVEAGLGMTVLPLAPVRGQLEYGALVARPLEGLESSTLPIALAQRPQQSLEGPARALVSIIRDHVGTLSVSQSQ